MAMEPSEEDVQTVMAVTGCAQDHALRYLRVKKTTEAALNAILDGEDISKEESSSVWTEDVWNTDREGNMNTGDSNLRPLGGTSTAPTRVPSPSGNMSVPANRDDEDAQLARAIAESQNGSSMAFQQESGVVHADGTQQSYGPVTKDQSAHDKQWGMVPISSHGASSEIVPDVERPEDRKNIEGEPRFLKNLPMGGYLPNFLTIGHSIPAMRKALLLTDYTMDQYGADAEWWKGHQIALPKIVHAGSGAPADAEIDRWDEFIAETQRLMAALDASDRSYASVNALTQSEVMSNAQRDDMVTSFIKLFLAASDARTNDMEDMRSIFCTKIGSSQGMNEAFAETLDVSFETTGKDDKVGLLEALDSLLWDTRSKDCEDRDNYIEQGAEVLVLSAKQENPKVEKLQLEAPSTLYIDKYLEKNVSVSKPLRLEIAEQRRRFTKLNTVISKLTEWPHPTQRDTKLDARVMLKHTLGHFSGKNMADASKEDIENGIVVNGTSEPEQPHYADIAAKLEAISLSVDKKIAKLQEQKEEIRKTISALSNSSPSQLEEEGLKERYTLMGVATKPNITYLLRPKAGGDDDIMSTDSQDEATPDGMQWWRIEYAVNGTHPHISKVPVQGDMVIQAIEVEHTSALLVYASDSAVDFSSFDHELPSALQKFVEDDNLFFNIELHDATRNNPPPAYDDYNAHDSEIPRQSIEPTPIRRGSMDSTCANLSGGNSRRGSFEDASVFNNGYSDGGLANSGLPPDSTNLSSSSTAQHVEHHESEDVTEIHLSPPQEHQEMVETKREGFAPQAGSGAMDATMEDDGGRS